jgi:predicted nucleic acid-binding protein
MNDFAPVSCWRPLPQRQRHDKVHEFWSDEVSLLDPNTIDSTRIYGPRPLTDIYLLALAVHHQGRFVTFDTGIALAAVRKAMTHNLVVL